MENLFGILYYIFGLLYLFERQWWMGLWQSYTWRQSLVFCGLAFQFATSRSEARARTARNSAGVSLIGAGTPALVPFYSAFPRALAGSWIGSRVLEAGTWHCDSGCQRGKEGLNLLCPHASPCVASYSLSVNNWTFGFVLAS